MKTFQPQKAGFWCTIFSLTRGLDSMPANGRGYVISQEGIDVIKEFTFGGPMVNDSFL